MRSIFRVIIEFVKLVDLYLIINNCAPLLKNIQIQTAKKEYLNLNKIYKRVEKKVLKNCLLNCTCIKIHWPCLTLLDAFEVFANSVFLNFLNNSILLIITNKTTKATKLNYKIN